MNFSTNYDDLNEFELIPEGIYEVIVKSAEENATSNGTPYLDIRLVVRNDVEQKCRDRYIFHKIWMKKDPTPQDMQVGGYSFKQLMNLANSVKIPAGKNYSSVAELCSDFVRKCAKAEIEHSTYNNHTNEKVKFFSATDHPDCRHTFKEKNTGSAAVQKYHQPENENYASQAALDPAEFEDLGKIDLPY